MCSPESAAALTSMKPVAVVPRLALAVPTVNVAALPAWACAGRARRTAPSAARRSGELRHGRMALRLRAGRGGAARYRDRLHHAVLEVRLAIFGIGHEADEHVVARGE